MKPVNVQYRYRKITDEVPEGQKIPAMTKAGMDRVKDGSPLRAHVGSRIFPHPRAGMTLLNRCDDSDPNWVFGELAVFAPGEHIPVIQDANTAPIVNLAQIKTPKGHHPLKGVLYWLAVENHLLAIQTPNMSLGTLTDYLNWLIYTPGISRGELVFDAQVSVANDISPPVNDIVIRATQSHWESMDSAKEPEWSPAPRKSYRTEDVDHQEITGEGRVLNILRAAAFGEANIEKLRDIAGKDGEIILEMHLKLKRERRLANFKKADALSLVSSLDDDNVILRGKNGRHVGNLQKLTYNMGRVKTIESLLDPDDAKRVLIEAYQSFCSNGYIEGPKIP